MAPHNKDKTLNTISIAANTAGFTGAASMGLSYAGLFANFFNSPVGAALTGIGSYILYPLVAFSSLTESALSWMTTNIDRRRKDHQLKSRHVANSVIATMSALGFTTAIIGSLVAATAFSLIAPIMFMAFIAQRAIYNLGAAIYWKHRAATVADNPKYQHDATRRSAALEKYHARASEHAKSAALGAMSFVATTTVFLLGYLFLAPIGIAVNAVFMALSIAGIAIGIKSALDKRQISLIHIDHADDTRDDADQDTDKTFTTSSANIIHTLGYAPIAASDSPVIGIQQPLPPVTDNCDQAPAEKREPDVYVQQRLLTM